MSLHGAIHFHLPFHFLSKNGVSLSTLQRFPITSLTVTDSLLYSSIHEIHSLSHNPSNLDLFNGTFPNFYFQCIFLSPIFYITTNRSLYYSSILAFCLHYLRLKLIMRIMESSGTTCFLKAVRN